MTPEDEKDPNCWVCHERGSQIFCPKCFLGFHIGCAVRTKEINSHERSFIKMCYQCSKIEKSRHLYTSSQNFKSVSKRILNSILNVVLIKDEGIKSPPPIFKTEQQPGMFEDVENFINFDTIKSKIKSNKYECTEEVLADLRKIEHTMLVGFKERNQTEVMTDYISQVSRFCQEIDLCPYCIYNHYLSPLGSAAICPWGHKLATIKHQNNLDHAPLDIFSMKRYSDLPLYYPAKVIAYSKCHTFVHIRLFFPGRPCSLRVPLENVLHLSNWSVKRCYGLMNNTRNQSLKEDFSDALKKLDIHLEELKQKFGVCDYPITYKRHWRSTDELFIDCDSSSTGRKRRSSNDSRKSIESRRQENSEPKSWKNQGTKTNKLTEDSNSRKRKLDIDLTNPPKKSARGESEAPVSTLIPSDDLSSEAQSDGCATEVASSDKSHLVLNSCETEPATSKDLSKVHASPAHTNLKASNGSTTEFLNSCDKNDYLTLLIDNKKETNYSDDTWLVNSEKDMPSSSVRSLYKSSDPTSKPKDILSSSKSSELENATITIVLKDDIAGSFPPNTPHQHRSTIGAKTNEPTPILTGKSNDISTKPLNEQIKNDREECQSISINHTREKTGLKDALLSKSVKGGDHTSLNVTSEKILDTKLATSQISSENSTRDSNLVISGEIIPSEEVNEDAETLPNDLTSISLDDIVRPPSPGASGQNSFEIIESEEESELHSLENRPNCQLRRIKLDKITNQQKSSSLDEVSKYEGKESMKICDFLKTHKERFNSVSGKLDISKMESIEGLESNERKSKKLESQANGEQSLTHGKTESAKDVELGIKNNSMVSESKFAEVIHQKVLPCSRCPILEKKNKEYEQAIIYHKIRNKALTKYCSELEKTSENPSLE